MRIDNAGHEAAVASALAKTAPPAKAEAPAPAEAETEETDAEEEPETEEAEEADAKEEPKEEKPAEKPKREGQGLRQFRRKLAEANQANERIIKRFSAYAHAEKAAESGDVDTFLRAMAHKGIDVRALLEGKKQAVKRDAEEPEAAKEEPKKPSAKDIAASVAGDAAVEEAVAKRLGDHPALKLDGGLAEIARLVSEGFDPKSGRAPNPRAIADKLVERAKAQAKALGFEPHEERTKRQAGSLGFDYEPGKGLDGAVAKAKPGRTRKPNNPAPTKKPGTGPRTIADVHEAAVARALLMTARRGQ